MDISLLLIISQWCNAVTGQKASIWEWTQKQFEVGPHCRWCWDLSIIEGIMVLLEEVRRPVSTSKAMWDQGLWDVARGWCKPEGQRELFFLHAQMEHAAT